MEFRDIFAEYFVQFRGQSANIPSFGNREFNKAIYFCNNSIRKWDRVDGHLWKELFTLGSEQTLSVWPIAESTISSATLDYLAPNNMRKPPKYVRFYLSTQSYFDVEVVPAAKAQEYSDLSNVIYFTGGANTGYTMHIGQKLADQYAGWQVDYIYVRKPTFLTTGSDPSGIIIDMSDPNFAIQDMLSTAFNIARNGFGYKTAQKEAMTALMNMKIEDVSGMDGNMNRFKFDSGWGANRPVDSFGRL